MEWLLRAERKSHTQDREAIRVFLAGVLWIDRSGVQWRFLPAKYGAWNSVCQRFARWDDLGVWERVFAGVADDPDLQSVLIDVTVVRALVRAHPKKRGSSGARARSLAGWVQQQVARPGRCPRQPAEVPAHQRRCGRQPADDPAAGRDRGG